MPYILGMAKVKGKVKILLDIDDVLTSQEVRGLEQLPGLAKMPSRWRKAITGGMKRTLRKYQLT